MPSGAPVTCKDAHTPTHTSHLEGEIGGGWEEANMVIETVDIRKR